MDGLAIHFPIQYSQLIAYQRDLRLEWRRSGIALKTFRVKT